MSPSKILDEWVSRSKPFVVSVGVIDPAPIFVHVMLRGCISAHPTVSAVGTGGGRAKGRGTSSTDTPDARPDPNDPHRPIRRSRCAT